MSILRIDHALGHVLAAEHLFLDFLNVPFLVEVMHLLAELANRIVVIAILVVLVEARKYVFQRRIFVLRYFSKRAIDSQGDPFSPCSLPAS